MTGREEQQVGALGLEAVKLLQALHEWTREGAGSAGRDTSSRLLRDLDDHFATGSKDCQYCPLCQIIAVVRTTSPEVKNHLAVAASSLLQAVAGVLAARANDPRSDSGPVERIDLDVDDWEDED